jgi:hypothetical protein
VRHAQKGEYDKAWKDVNKARTLGFQVPQEMIEHQTGRSNQTGDAMIHQAVMKPESKISGAEYTPQVICQIHGKKGSGHIVIQSPLRISSMHTDSHDGFPLTWAMAVVQAPSNLSLISENMPKRI